MFPSTFFIPPGKIRKGDVDLSVELNEADKVLTTSIQKSFFQKAISILKIVFIPLAVIFLGYYLFSGKTSASNSLIDPGKQEISLAVLPFKNLADSAANQYFVEGLRDQILTSLSKIHSLRVISILSEKMSFGNNVSASTLEGSYMLAI